MRQFCRRHSYRGGKSPADIIGTPTAGGKLYVATVIDLFSRRLIGAATSLHPNPELAKPHSRWR